MVKENQQLSDDLSSKNETIDKLHEKHGDMQHKIDHLDQYSRIKETDIDDLKHAYQAT